MQPDEEVRVIVLPLPPEEWGWALTPEGDAALDESLRGEPTIPSARAVADRMAGHLAAAAQAVQERAVADEARDLARQRRNPPIDGDPPALL